MRIVRTPEGEIVADFSGKRSGRGAYTCPEASCLKDAVSGGRLARALQSEIDSQRLAELQKDLDEGLQQGLLFSRRRMQRRG